MGEVFCVMNKQPQTADKGWSSSLGVGLGLTTPDWKIIWCIMKLHGPLTGTNYLELEDWIQDRD
jgi:hypothetical protein